MAHVELNKQPDGSIPTMLSVLLGPTENVLKQQVTKGTRWNPFKEADTTYVKAVQHILTCVEDTALGRSLLKSETKQRKDILFKSFSWVDAFPWLQYDHNRIVSLSETDLNLSKQWLDGIVRIRIMMF